jgi:DNA-cytosine methyltransferase
MKLKRFENFIKESNNSQQEMSSDLIKFSNLYSIYPDFYTDEQKDHLEDLDYTLERMNKNNSINYFSLFAGIGGPEMGAPKSWKNVGYSELDKSSIEVYKSNFPSHTNYGDITKIDFDLLKTHVKIDFIIGGFPCQPFSSSGAQRGLDDHRKGLLLLHIIRMINDIDPGYILLENVSNLVNSFSSVFDFLNAVLPLMNYTLEYKMYNTNDISPVNRKRVFILIKRKGLPGELPSENFIDNIYTNKKMEPNRKGLKWKTLLCPQQKGFINRVYDDNNVLISFYDTYRKVEVNILPNIDLSKNIHYYESTDGIKYYTYTPNKNKDTRYIYVERQHTSGIKSILAQGGGEIKNQEANVILEEDNDLIRPLNQQEMENALGYPRGYTRVHDKLQDVQFGIGNSISPYVAKWILFNLNNQITSSNKNKKILPNNELNTLLVDELAKINIFVDENMDVYSEINKPNTLFFDKGRFITKEDQVIYNLNRGLSIEEIMDKIEIREDIILILKLTKKFLE